ncbi:MAG: hypothetical protein M3Y65_06915 [Pseudomonadota bacterium]|nr:hypothetical protein [Pseudomonadota bacterium]
MIEQMDWLAARLAVFAVLLPCAVGPALSESQSQSKSQSQLPAPSRTIYKCVVKGAVSYSDEPCAGARRLDATPTSGVTHLSGSSRVGKDVANEIHREQFAAALRPLHGMNTSQFDTKVRRDQLDLSAQRECHRLEPAILQLEEAERHADAAAVKPIQQDLLTLRKRYKTLTC